MMSSRLVREGHSLFRFRGVLPLVMILPLALSLWGFKYLNESRELQHYWYWFSILISMLGLLVRVTTVGFVAQGTSGRNTRSQVAESLNTTGWYSVCRNPLYLGNCLIGLGIAADLHDPVLVIAYGAIFWLYYERIIATEEQFLSGKFGEQYTSWAIETPVFLPAFDRWKKPVLRFCWRTVLRREYPAVLLICLAFPMLDSIEHFLIEGVFIPERHAVVMCFAGVGIFMVLRYLKKHTRCLEVQHRAPELQ